MSSRIPMPLLLIPTICAYYCLIVLALPGQTTAPPAYDVIRQATGGDNGLAWILAAVAVGHTLACLTHQRSARTALLLIAASGWSFLFAGIMLAAPRALLPGLTLAPVLCCCFAVYMTQRR